MRGGFGMGMAGGSPGTFGLHWHFERGRDEGPKPEVSRAMLKRIVPYFRPYWLRWGAIIACIGSERVLDVLPPFCVAAIIDQGIPQGNYRLVGLLAAAMVGLAFTSGLISVLEQTLTARVGQSIMYDMRNDLYRHLQKMSLGFYTRTRSGEIVSRVNNDVNAVQGVTTGTLPSIASNIIALAVVSTALFSKNWRLALLAVTIVPVFYLPSRIVGGIRRRLSVQTQESQAGLLAFMNERLHIGGAILTNIFGQRKADAQEFADRSARVRDLTIRQSIVGRWLRMVLVVFASIGPALIYWYGGRQVIGNPEAMSTGLLVAFAALLGQLYRPLMQLATVYVDIQGAFGVFERIFDYLDMRPDISDQAEPKGLPEARGHLVFEDVCFAYPKAPALPAPDAAEPNGTRADAFALHDVRFEIRPGRQVALVGPSGAGKTTITYLVPRFYDPTAGRILLDGHDLREIGQEELRRHIGMVTQETFLFHDTLRRNLLYARPDASESDLIDACTAANIHDFIDSLPERYDTVVGERGFRLSGGEKQRVSIARALLKDPSILILDEATSSLDATSEYLIQQALEKLLRGRTSLIIAHRLSTILSSDLIVVMDEGRVVETGSHEELLEHRGLYAGLFERQFGKVLEMDGARRDGALISPQKGGSAWDGHSAY
jgi:ATP-binding cassette subfamily B protein